MPNIDTTIAGLSKVSAKLYGQKNVDSSAGYVEIVGNATFTVGASGCDFTNIDDAFKYVEAALVYSGASIHLVVKDGTYTHTSALRATNYNFLPVYVSAEHVYTRVVSSVQSASGSSGSWSIVINLDSVTNISVGDWLLINETDGGTNPTFLAGAHEITDVDAVNNRVTIASKHKNAAAPSGAVVAAATVLKVILKFTACSGIQVFNNVTMGLFSDVMFVGDATAGTAGLSIQDGSRFYVDGKIGVSGFDYNVFSLYGSEINGDGTIVSSGALNYGFIAADSGIISLASGAVASGSGQIGVCPTRGGQIHLPGAIVTGCSAQGVVATSKGLFTCGTSTPGTSTGNGTYGVDTNSDGYVNPLEIVSSGNANADRRRTVLSSLELVAVSGATQVAQSFTAGANNSYITQNGAYLQAVNNSGIIDVDGKTGVRIKINGVVNTNINSTGIGFNGAAPIAKPILPTGAGKTVDEVIAVLQNYGLVSQS